MIISAGLLIISYLSIYVNPAKAWFMTIFGLLFYPLLLVNVLLLVWALLRRSKAVVIPLVALIPTLLIFGKFFRFSTSRDDTSKGLKIVSYNVGRFALPQGVTFSSRKECADSIMAFLRAGDADIICLQEVYVQNKERVLSYLSRQMKGYDIQYYVNVKNMEAAAMSLSAVIRHCPKGTLISNTVRTWRCIPTIASAVTH